MDTLLQMSDNLLRKMITYEKILNYTLRIENELKCLSKQWSETGRNDLLLARIYITTAACVIHNKLRVKKWEEIQNLSDNITQTAISVGYTSYQTLIEHRIPTTNPTPDATFVTQTWADTELLDSRKD